MHPRDFKYDGPPAKSRGNYRMVATDLQLSATILHILTGPSSIRSVALFLSPLACYDVLEASCQTQVEIIGH